VGVWGARPPNIVRNDVVRAFRGHTSPELVEVPGIEPGSCGGSSGLLRAQFALSLLDPISHANELM